MTDCIEVGQVDGWIDIRLPIEGFVDKDLAARQEIIDDIEERARKGQLRALHVGAFKEQEDGKYKGDDIRALGHGLYEATVDIGDEYAGEVWFVFYAYGEGEDIERKTHFFDVKGTEKEVKPVWSTPTVTELTL